MTTVDLFTKEHDLGLHDKFRPRNCPTCLDEFGVPAHIVDEQLSGRVKAPVRGDEGTLGAGFDILRRDIAKRVRRDSEPPDLNIDLDRNPKWIDDDPFCDACHGARTVALGTFPPTYGPCPVCRNAPWAVQKRIDKVLGQMPESLRKFRLDTYPLNTPEQVALRSQVDSWLDDPTEPWGFFTGPVGRGKTGLAAACEYELAQRGMSGYFMSTVELLAAIKTSYDAKTGDPTGHDILTVLVQIGVFVLDDGGAEYHKRDGDDWATEKIFEVIDARYKAHPKGRTIVTSNLTLREWGDKLGHPRIPSRIHERCGATGVIDFARVSNLRMRSARAT